MNELVPHVSSNSPAPYFSGTGMDARRQNRELTHARRAVRNEVTLANDKIDGRAALAEHAMHRLAEIDNTRRHLAGNDEALSQAMAEFEINFIRSVARDQIELFRGF